MNAGLILAAGESRRMGFPKALLPYRDESFLDRLVGLFTPHCSTIVVVLGARAAEIRAAARRPATFVLNPDWQRGQLSSMQCGLAAVPAEADGVLFTLVDHPAVTPETVGRLAALGQADGFESASALRIPRFQNRRGHPVWFSRALVSEFLALGPDRSAKDVVHAHASQTLFLDVDDPGIVADIDDPAAYRDLTGAAV